MTKSPAIERQRRYGCIPDHPDQRDIMFTPPGLPLPVSIDLSPIMPPVLDQGQIGSCTGHGSSEAVAAALIKANHPYVPLSRLFPYYNGRAYEGTTGQDAGAMIRDVVKGLAKLGAATEAEWPYSESYSAKPSKAAYADGAKRQVLEYRRVPVSVTALKQALAAGFPVIIGISVYESFESADAARTGVIPMPSKDEQMLGGHCMLAFGYDDIDPAVPGGCFQVRNSWGMSWGLTGNCKIPYAYLGNSSLASDFWTLTSIEFSQSD